jgi:hypothetical protein
MKSVYRVEHSTKKCPKNNKINTGPYYYAQGYKSIKDKRIISDKANYSLEHPGLRQDYDIVVIMSKNIKNPLFAFPSINKVNEWFDEECKKILKRNNYILRKYFLKDESIVLLGESKKQVIFTEDSVIRKRKINW